MMTLHMAFGGTMMLLAGREMPDSSWEWPLEGDAGSSGRTSTPQQPDSHGSRRLRVAFTKLYRQSMSMSCFAYLLQHGFVRIESQVAVITLFMNRASTSFRSFEVSAYKIRTDTESFDALVVSHV